MYASTLSNFLSSKDLRNLKLNYEKQNLDLKTTGKSALKLCCLRGRSSRLFVLSFLSLKNFAPSVLPTAFIPTLPAPPKLSISGLTYQAMHKTSWHLDSLPFVLWSRFPLVVPVGHQSRKWEGTKSRILFEWWHRVIVHFPVSVPWLLCAINLPPYFSKPSPSFYCLMTGFSHERFLFFSFTLFTVTIRGRH